MLALPFAIAASLALALSSIAVEQQSIPQVDRQIADELQRLEGALDPVSANILRANQADWVRRTRALDQRVADILKSEPAEREELAKVGGAVRQQRLVFLAGLKVTPAAGLSGGWTDGVTEVLFDLIPNGRAELVSTTDDQGGKPAICVVDGLVRTSPDGLTIVPDGQGDRVVRLRRLGIALSIEEERPSSDHAPAHCRVGGVLAGQYFRIEEAEALLPWLLH